jgi:hypothetical protein
VIRIRITVLNLVTPDVSVTCRVQHLTRESTGSDWPQIDKKQYIFSSATHGIPRVCVN